MLLDDEEPAPRTAAQDAVQGAVGDVADGPGADRDLMDRGRGRIGVRLDIDIAAIKREVGIGEAGQVALGIVEVAATIEFAALPGARVGQP